METKTEFPLPLRASTMDLGMRTISRGTGSWLLDVCVGGGVGYLLAKPGQRVGTTVAGAVLTGVAGLLGMALVVGYVAITRKAST